MVRTVKTKTQNKGTSRGERLSRTHDGERAYPRTVPIYSVVTRHRALEPWPKRTVMLADEEFAIGVPDLSDEEADDDDQCTHAVSSASTWADDGGSSSSEEEWQDDGMSSSPPHPPYASVPYEVVCRSPIDPSYALLRWDCRQ